METVQEIYRREIAPLALGERLRLASLILDGVTEGLPASGHLSPEDSDEWSDDDMREWSASTRLKWDESVGDIDDTTR